jgi:hypothetical protein
MAPHYFEKNAYRVYYVMLAAGTTFEVFETRRYFNQELWPQWTASMGGHTGVIGHQESDYNTLLWVNGPLIYLSPWHDVKVKETVHKRCQDKWTSLGKVGCTEIFYHRREDGEEYIRYDDKEVRLGEIFTYHESEITAHQEDIQYVLGQIGLELQDRCGGLPANPKCDEGCAGCPHENEWRIIHKSTLPQPPSKGVQNA